MLVIHGEHENYINKQVLTNNVCKLRKNITSFSDYFQRFGLIDKLLSPNPTEKKLHGFLLVNHEDHGNHMNEQVLTNIYVPKVFDRIDNFFSLIFIKEKITWFLAGQSAEPRQQYQ